MDKQTAATQAVNAGADAETAINTHGLYSPQARQAVADATVATLTADAAGCTRADYDAAHARRQ
jgi:hypothetical protein